MTSTFHPIKIDEYPGSTGSRFKKNHVWYVEQLSKLADSWHKYLTHYLETTKDLFGNAELPWGKNERVLVSSLAAAIVLCNKKAIIAEELPVEKYSDATEHGRCDLWAHIPSEDDRTFNFYMEAKRFRKERKVDEIKDRLSGQYGIERMLYDYAKNRNGKCHQRSAYRDDPKRDHQHCVIGLICMPLIGIRPDNFDEIEKSFQAAYGMRYETPNEQHRLIQRYPTFGFVFAANNEAGDAMLIGMTILGE